MRDVDGAGAAMNWSRCSGPLRRHWGRYGAAGLLVSAIEGASTYVLLDERAAWVHHGGTVGIPGGAIHDGEEPLEAALREAAEEVRGLDPALLDFSGSHVEPCADCRSWTYTTILARSPRAVDVTPASFESAGVRWVALDDVSALPLHPGFASAWPKMRALL
jgi:8-oxo-dGTP diphosphatase